MLRQQLIAAHRKLRGRVAWTPWQRLVMALAARWTPVWRQALLLVQPATVLRWHRDGLRALWRRRSRRSGRAPTPRAGLIRQMARDNPRWGAERIRGELLKLGIRVVSMRLVSDLPGLASCIVTQNVYSDNGKVLLLERGSEATGEYSAGMAQGQSRVFVLWSRIKTPTGVVILTDLIAQPLDHAAVLQGIERALRVDAAGQNHPPRARPIPPSSAQAYCLYHRFGPYRRRPA